MACGMCLMLEVSRIKTALDYVHRKCGSVFLCTCALGVGEKLRQKGKLGNGGGQWQHLESGGQRWEPWWCWELHV